jgi:hypothetical protein
MNFSQSRSAPSLFTRPVMRSWPSLLKEHWIENWVQIFATSNSYNALKIDDQDRRWFVPGVVEEKRPLEYFIGFRKWLEERDRAIARIMTIVSARLEAGFQNFEYRVV